MMIPQLRGDTIADVVRWVKEFLASEKLKSPSGEAASAPVGSIGQTQLWFSAILPDGWIAIDGSLHFQSEYPDLFALIGLAFDPTPPPSMFRLPPNPNAASGTWIIRAK